MPGTTQIEADLLVIGGGMAGMTAAGRAASLGATVMVIEKGPEIGGSAVISAGGLVAPESYEAFRALNPGGDPDLNRVLVDRYEDLVEWVEGTGVHVSTPPSGVRAFGIDPVDLLGQPTRARVFDVLGYMNTCRNMVTTGGGWVVTGAHVEELLVEGRRVVGARAHDAESVVEVRAPWTLLATGGFQNNREMLREYLGEGEANALIRSNPNSAGDGLRLAQSAGATTSGDMTGFYGHPIMWPINHEFNIDDYTRLALSFIGPFGVVLDRQGRRFFDESLGYWVNSQAIFRQPDGHALVVGDSTRLGLITEGETDMGHYDRIEEAARVDAHAAVAETLEDLEQLVEPWGYRGIAATIHEFNRDVTTNPEAMTPPRSRNRAPIGPGPFLAIEAQPSITFTFGGIKIDDHARVLDAAGNPVPGLLAAGADAGGFYREGYCGGLGMSGTMALQAADLLAQGLPARA